MFAQPVGVKLNTEGATITPPRALDAPPMPAEISEYSQGFQFMGAPSLFSLYDSQTDSNRLRKASFPQAHGGSFRRLLRGLALDLHRRFRVLTSLQSRIQAECWN